MSRPKLILVDDGLSYETIKKARKSEKTFKRVIKITDRISIRFGRTSGIKQIEIDDLIQEGRIVAWKAVHDYHDNSDAKFTTYFTQCLKNHFGHKRGKQKAEKRKIDLKAESLFKQIEENAQLINVIVDEKAERSLKNILDEVEVNQLMELLDETGYMLCRFILRGLTFDEIAKKMKTTLSKVKVLFKNHVVKQIQEAQKLGVI